MLQTIRRLKIPRSRRAQLVGTAITPAWVYRSKYSGMTPSAALRIRRWEADALWGVGWWPRLEPWIAWATEVLTVVNNWLARDLAARAVILRRRVDGYSETLPSLRS